MANVQISAGSKLYNICYGPMTVVGFYSFGSDDTKVVCCTVDDYENLAGRYKALYEWTPQQNYDRPDFNNGKYIKWFESSIGTFVFTNPRDAAAVPCDEHHGYFKKGDFPSPLPEECGESGIGVAPTSKGESGIGIEPSSDYRGESGVGVEK